MSTTVLSVLLGVCGMVGWGVYDYLGGALSRRLGPFVPLLWSQAAGMLAIAGVAVVVRPEWDLSPRSLWLVPVAAGLYCGGYLCFFRGLEQGTISVVAAAMNLWAVVTMAVAFVVAGQRLSGPQTVGALAIIVGATVASVEWGELGDGGVRASAGVPVTLVGAVFFGLYWNVSEVISEDAGWLPTTVLIKVAVTATLLGVMAVRRRQARPAGARGGTLAVLVAMGLVEVVAVAAVNYGLTIGDAILITPIASALSVVTIVLAVVFHHDRVVPLQGLGMALAVAGIVATAL